MSAASGVPWNTLVNDGSHFVMPFSEGGWMNSPWIRSDGDGRSLYDASGDDELVNLQPVGPDCFLGGASEYVSLSLCCESGDGAVNISQHHTMWRRWFVFCVSKLDATVGGRASFSDETVTTVVHNGKPYYWINQSHEDLGVQGHGNLALRDHEVIISKNLLRIHISEGGSFFPRAARKT